MAVHTVAVCMLYCTCASRHHHSKHTLYVYMCVTSKVREKEGPRCKRRGHVFICTSIECVSGSVCAECTAPSEASG